MDIFADKGLSVERLRSLLDVFKHGGIARSAPEDVGRQNLVGRQLRELETFFGTKLTEKKGKVIQLNKTGKELALLSRNFLGALEDLKRQALKKRKIFRIAAGGTVYSEVLAPRLSKLRQLELEVHLHEDVHEGIFESLAAFELDGAVVWSDVPPVLGFRTIEVGEITYQLFSPKKGAVKISTRDTFLSMPLALVQFRDLSKELERRATSPDLVYVDENIAAFRLVEEGAYSAVLPTVMGQRLSHTHVQAITLPFLDSYKRMVRFVWNPRCATMRGFTNSLLEKIAQRFKF